MVIQHVVQLKMITEATNSRGEKVADIQALNAEVTRLNGAVDWWNSAIIVMMVVAALAATGLLLTQYIAFRRARQLSEAQTRLDTAKETETNLALRDKDIKLAELQKAALPRNFDPQKIAAKLPKIEGLRFRVYSLSDFEAWHTGALIAAAGQYADWVYGGGGGGSSDELTKPGVWIEVSPMPETTQGPRIDIILKHSEEERAHELKRLRSAADALCSALNAEGVEAKVRDPVANRENLMIGNEPDSLTVFVSLKPMPGMPDDLTVFAPKPNTESEKRK